MPRRKPALASSAEDSGEINQTLYRTMANGKEDRHFVTAVARAFEVLLTFDNANVQHSNQTIAQLSGLPRSTVARLTHTLLKLEYLDLGDSPAKYKLGLASQTFGAIALRGFGLKQLALPYLQRIANETGAAVSLTVRDGLQMVFLENVRGPAAVTLNVSAGGRVPIQLGSYGWAYLAACGAEEREELLRALEAEMVGDWAGARAKIDEAIAQFSQFGYCLSIRQWHPDVNGIAVAFRRPGSKHPVVLGCAGPASQLTQEYLRDSVHPLLAQAAAAIETGLLHEVGA
jgi:DNA-binding IclR family transcriptional regulator